VSTVLSPESGVKRSRADRCKYLAIPAARAARLTVLGFGLNHLNSYNVIHDE
jgi:hypothetical protein